MTVAAGEAFVWLDRQLDTAKQGPMFLRKPEIAQVMVSSIHKGSTWDTTSSALTLSWQIMVTVQALQKSRHINL